MARKNTAAAPEPAQLAIDIPEATMKPRVSVVPRAYIHPDPAQPRVDADDELRASIAQNGLIQPITVRPHPTLGGQYLLVDGERRWRGSEGILDELPVIIRRDQEDDAQRLVTQLVANTGKPLSPIEEARAFRKVLDAFGGSIEALAQKLGRPRTTVAERLQLLELGPWLTYVERGLVPVSYAVRALLPVRAVSDERHGKAIEELGLEGCETMDDLGLATFDDFRDAIRDQYKRFMYPLAKSKTDWEPQPLFNTRKHDAECGCGTVPWSFGYGGNDRKACCNPDWWGPLDRAAKKELKAKEKASQPAGQKKAADKPKVFLPSGTPVMKCGYELPKGVTSLTSSDGRWAPDRGYRADPFDPADLTIDDSKLVGIHRYNGLEVGTKDGAAVKKARAAWAARWAARRAELDAEFRAALDAALPTLKVVGPGLNGLLVALLASESRRLSSEFGPVLLAQTLQLPIPEDLMKQAARNYGQTDPGAQRAWLTALPIEQVERLAAAIALLGIEGGPKLPSDQVEAERAVRLDAIARKQSPWAKMPKATKAAKASKPATKAVAPAAPVDTSALVCTGCGCTEDDACEGGCHWVSTTPAVCSQCAENDAAVDADIASLDGGDEELWGAGADEELQEVES